MKRRCHGWLAIVAIAWLGCGRGPQGSDDDVVDPLDAGASPRDADDADAAPVDADPTPPDADASFPFVRCDAARAPLPPLVEDRAVYQQDALGVWTLRVTVDDLMGLAAVNAGVDGAEVRAQLHDDVVGGQAASPGATLKIRGGASRVNAQKNYKLELDDGLRWHGQKEINLNKHMWDLTRVRNKLAFDLFTTIEHFTSLRTQFVHLFVNGEDHGLYTWIEEPDRRFLTSHGLDPDGQLYKSNNFFFQTIAPAVAADPLAFEAIAEAKANPDDAKFLQMVAAVNDRSRDFDTVIDTYFNRDNLVTWLAVNVLLNNIDTRSQNFYLYSPSSCDGWYLLPWDYDGAWGFYGQLEDDDRERWERGLSNWWALPLFERFFRDPDNLAAIHARVLALSETALTDALVAARIASYHDHVLGYISVEPDLHHLPGHHGDAPASVGISLWEGESLRITTTVSRFRAEYLTVLERPMPSRIRSDLDRVPLRFWWDRSFDLQHDPIRYDFQISRTAAFAPSDIVHALLDTTEDELAVSGLAPGAYFWRIVIHDHQTADSWQLPFSDPYKPITVR